VNCPRRLADRQRRHPVILAIYLPVTCVCSPQMGIWWRYSATFKRDFPRLPTTGRRTFIRVRLTFACPVYADGPSGVYYNSVACRNTCLIRRFRPKLNCNLLFVLWAPSSFSKFDLYVAASPCSASSFTVFPEFQPTPLCLHYGQFLSF
jgi:hypothetical protein